MDESPKPVARRFLIWALGLCLFAGLSALAWSVLRNPLPFDALLHPAAAEAYAIAAEHPDLLREMPCFCGCQGMGHRSNLDCFVSRWSITGQPVWNSHGFT